MRARFWYLNARVDLAGREAFSEEKDLTADVVSGRAGAVQPAQESRTEDVLPAFDLEVAQVRAHPHPLLLNCVHHVLEDTENKRKLHNEYQGSILEAKMIQSNM